MEQSNLLKLAKQGEPTAIAALMNAVLEPRGIKAQASFEADVLCVCLESPKPLNQETLVTFIRKGLLELENESIQRVRAQGKRIGEKDFAWSKEFLVHPAKRVEAPPVQPEVNEVVANEVPTVEENLPAISTAPNSEATVTGVVPEETHSEIESIAPLSHAISESEVESVSETPENPPEIDLSLDPVALPPEEASEDDLTEEDDESEEDDPLEPQSLRAWLKLYWRAYSLPVLLVIVGGFIAGGAMAFWSTSKPQNSEPMEEVLQPRDQTAESKQNEAEKYLKAMNQAQEEFFRKNKRFANSLEELERSANLIAQSYSYAYRLRVTEAEKATETSRSIITASPREAGLKSYVSGVFVLPSGATSIICETPKPSMEAPSAPQVIKKKLACAPRSTKVQ